MTVEDYVEDDDFLIRIRPIMEKTVTNNVEWTGQIDVSIMSAGGDLDPDDYAQIMHLCKMVCAAVPIMESNEEFGQAAHNFVMEMEHPDDDDDDDIDIQITQGDGNIVHLNFSSKTKGSA
jgi:hypothetical protein